MLEIVPGAFTGGVVVPEIALGVKPLCRKLCLAFAVVPEIVPEVCRRVGTCCLGLQWKL